MKTSDWKITDTLPRFHDHFLFHRQAALLELQSLARGQENGKSNQSS